MTYFAEFLPRRARGVCITCIEVNVKNLIKVLCMELVFIFTQVWWAFGSMFGAALAIGVMRPGGLGWHWYLGLAATPLALVWFLFPVSDTVCNPAFLVQ